MTDSHDILTPIQKREKFGRNEGGWGPVGLKDFIFVGGGEPGGSGGMQLLYIYNVNL